MTRIQNEFCGCLVLLALVNQALPKVLLNSSTALVDWVPPFVLTGML
jgi:hypothetical protein